jgi:hypothetical protein
MKTVRENLTEWFSTAFGGLLLLAIAINAFTDFPQKLDWSVSISIAILAGVLMFGNPKTFFTSMGTVLVDKFKNKSSK